MTETTTTEEWTHDVMVEGLWRTGEKLEISILYERQDKSRYSGQAVKGSREWKDFFFKFTPEQVDQFTEAHRIARGVKPASQRVRNDNNNDRQQIQKREDKQAMERKKAADELETLFRAKLEAFEIPEVRDSENRGLRSRIRKSKSLTEISALVAALITLSVLEPKDEVDEESGEKVVKLDNFSPDTISEVANEVPKDED
tara:strand:- start:2162 stop:2761 length:600 start_codon:yes stop_codon:yes gene_type:complete